MKIERLLNFLAQTDKLWNRQQMLERARQVFLKVYLSREQGDPGKVPAEDLFPEVAEDLRRRLLAWEAKDMRIEYRNLCARKAELILVRNFSDPSRDEFVVRISAHAQKVVRRGEAEIERQEDVAPFEEYWTFGRLDGRWKLKEVLPSARAEALVGQENIDEDSSPRQLQWYYSKSRAV